MMIEIKSSRRPRHTKGCSPKEKEERRCGELRRSECRGGGLGTIKAKKYSYEINSTVIIPNACKHKAQSKVVQSKSTEQ
jgi:hypothetical protein